MITAAFLIALVAFVGRLVLSAIAIRNWWTVTILVAVAVVGYVALRMSVFSVDELLRRLHLLLGLGLLVLMCVFMLAVGFGVPTLLSGAEQASVARRSLALFGGVAVMILAADLLRGTTMNVLPSNPFLVPQLWFVAGVVCFVVLKSGFYDRDGDSPGDSRRRSDSSKAA